MIRILVTVYNCRPCIEACLTSLLSQTVANWRCYLLDDLSKDGSLDHAINFLQRDDRFVFVRNQQKLYQVGNYDQILQRSEIAGDDICVSLDGDDWLSDPNVFTRIIEAYDPSTWVTWGSYVRFDGLNARPGQGKELTDVTALRSEEWIPSHLRTWRAFLWRKIDANDLRGPDGGYWRVAGDLAFMYPMIEMAGRQHSRFLSSINYVYNTMNPLINHKIRPNEQQRNDKLIRAKRSYVLKIF